MGAHKEMAYPTFEAVGNASGGVLRMWHNELPWPRTFEEYVIRRYIEKRNHRFKTPVVDDLGGEF